MFIVLDILCPDRDDNTPTEQVAPEKREEKIDRERMTRVQVINIHGQIVDIEY